MKTRRFCISLLALSFAAFTAKQVEAAPIPTKNTSTQPIVPQKSTFTVPGFGLRDGDRVVFYGDSITEHRFYTMFVETFVLTRFPKWRMRFFNAGWGGDKVTGGPDRPIDLRLHRDVIAHNPSVITVMLGMNDAGWRAFDPQLFATYQNGYEHIIDVLQRAKPQSRITALWPSPFDDITQAPRFNGGYNRVLEYYGTWIQHLAEHRGLNTANLNTPVVQALQRANTIDAVQAQKIMGDRAHPSPSGHLLMATALLEAWRAPSLVSDVHLDAAARKLILARNTRVSQLLRTKDSLSWVQNDNALPFPLDRADPLMALVSRVSSFDTVLNKQMLRVLNLPKSRYHLQIDGVATAELSSEQLQRGINLATFDTPMTRQAQAVHNLTLQRNRVQYTSWRHVQLPLQDIQSTKYREVLRALGTMENDLILQQRTAAQPKTRTFSISPISPAVTTAE
jgi:lysophospholipase L1-like esterase